jgi:hypothetical protein
VSLYDRQMSKIPFMPATSAWFEAVFDEPTPAQ